MPFSSYFTQISDPLLAPLWADFITLQETGSIFYRTTTNNSILHHVTEIIRDANSNYSDYQPQAATVVTWADVLPYGLILSPTVCSFLLRSCNFIP